MRPTARPPKASHISLSLRKPRGPAGAAADAALPPAPAAAIAIPAAPVRTARRVSPKSAMIVSPPALRRRQWRHDGGFATASSAPPDRLQRREPVAVRELGEERLVVAVGGERAEERGQAGGVADAGRDHRAVEVGAQADMVLAECGDQVVEVAQHRLPAGV